MKILKKQAGIMEDESKIKKKKKKKGPNPLSCLKKKKKKEESTALSKTSAKSGKIRKKKIKIAPHIKEVLMAELKSKHET